MPSLYTQAVMEAYSSAPSGVSVVQTLEISSSAWASNQLLTNCGQDFSAFDENSVYKTFANTSFVIERQKKDDEGVVMFTVSLDNTSLEIKQLINQAYSTNEYPLITFRVFLSSDTTQPAEYPLQLKVISSDANLLTITLNCSNDDDINAQFPRPEYDYKASNFPGLVR